MGKTCSWYPHWEAFATWISCSLTLHHFRFFPDVAITLSTIGLGRMKPIFRFEKECLLVALRWCTSAHSLNPSIIHHQWTFSFVLTDTTKPCWRRFGNWQLAMADAYWVYISVKKVSIRVVFENPVVWKAEVRSWTLDVGCWKLKVESWVATQYSISVCFPTGVAGTILAWDKASCPNLQI